MKSQNGAVELEQFLQECLRESNVFFGDASGPFSTSRARVIEADAELECRGLGHTALGFGINATAGDPKKLSELTADAENGDPAAFEAAMRYVGNRLFQIDEFPLQLSLLASKVLLGIAHRPPKRKAKDSGLSARNVAVFALVEIAKLHGSITTERAFSIVADTIRRSGKNPNNAQTVKRVYLETRARLRRETSVHDLAVLASFPMLGETPEIDALISSALGADR